MLANGDEDWKDQSGDWVAVAAGLGLLAVVIGLSMVLPQWVTEILGVAFIVVLVEFVMRSS